MRNTVLSAAIAALLGAGASLAQPDLYQEGQRAIRNQQWDVAEELFVEVERQSEEYADAAIYWQAYALCRSGKERQGRRRIRNLERKHPDSAWIDDAQTLRVDCGADSDPVLAGDTLDPELQIFILSQMMDRDPDRALPLVMEMVQKTDSDEVRRQALFVLGVAESEEANLAIARIARDSDNRELQIEAIHMLGAAGDEDAVVFLHEVYESTEDVEIRRAILHSYMIAENEDLVLQALRSTDVPELQREAIQALGVMEATDALRGLYAEITDRESRMILLQSMAIAEDTEALMEALETETDPELRTTAIQSIAIAGDDIAGDFLARVYERSTSRDEKAAVINALVIIEDEDLAVHIARTETDPEFQGAAIQVLGIMEASDVLRDLYGNIQDRGLRAMVLQSLAIAQDVDGLIAVLRAENDPELRYAAIQGLAISDDDDAADYLADTYPDSGIDEKRAIIQSMMILDDADALVRMLRVEEDKQLKREILQTLSLIDSDEATEYLFELMEQDR